MASQIHHHSKQFILIVLMFSLFYFTVDSTSRVGWSPISNPNKPKFVVIGKFAVSEHNTEAKTNLKFVNVVKGDIEVTDGAVTVTEYRLVIAAKDGGAVSNYKVLVSEEGEFQLRKLSYFTKL
ncbi:cysteine proteinase inhibitor 1-like [Impatiens glandulifera]|uniref:cysteine proteinase inhibitor 1-like n=1 Tax=Impatiens glandulifera TaxID=253017 RepID=UPI001FB142FA|nr:cysteine proteinase inhibitor 1-like [Impatiens glandulifera]